jgi:uncharacterized DUF497 family protein
MVEIEFDPAKDALNIAKHGLSFTDFSGFDRDPALTVDSRMDYGETRYRAFGRISGAGYCLVFTVRGEAMRIIGFRRARDKEMSRYE